MSVDVSQMQMFDYYSSVWWDPHGPVGGLQKGCEFIFQYVVTTAAARGLVENVRVLDVGCGGGLLAEPLARHGFSVVGIDVNRNLIDVAQNHSQLDYSLTNLTYKHESVENHADSNVEKYDIVVLNFVLQHVKDHNLILSKCVKTLKPGEIIVLGQGLFGYIPKGAHNWYNFIDAEKVDAILSKNRCSVIEKRGLYYNVVSKNWDWCKKTNAGFYSIFAVKN